MRNTMSVAIFQASEDFSEEMLGDRLRERPIDEEVEEVSTLAVFKYNVVLCSLSTC